MSQASSDGGSPRVGGIDVSDNNGTVDWTQVKSDGYAFAFIKATDGVSLPSSVKYFDTNWPQIEAAGIIRGSYHFYESADDPQAQANYFADTLAAAGGLGTGDLPPVLDFEKPTAAANVLAFLNQIETRTKRTPIINVNGSFASTYLSEPKFANYPLWLAEYGVATPTVPATWKDAGQSWTFWQYSQSSSVRGVAVHTDLDRFNGDTNALSSFIRSTIR